MHMPQELGLVQKCIHAPPPRSAGLYPLAVQGGQPPPETMQRTYETPERAGASMVVVVLVVGLLCRRCSHWPPA